MDYWGHSWTNVVGILCSICWQLENYDTFDGQQQQQRNGGKFVNVPYCNMGDFVEQKQTHESGSINSIDPVSYRGKIVEGTVPVPWTAHMKFFLIKKTTDNVTTKGKAIDNTMNNMGVNISKRNQIAVMQLCSMLHRTIKRRDAVFSSLKDSVLFCIEVLDCQSLKCLLKSGTKGISNRKLALISRWLKISVVMR